MRYVFTLQDSTDGELTHSIQKAPLSCSLLLESHEGRRLTDLINMRTEPGTACNKTSR